MGWALFRTFKGQGNTKWKVAEKPSEARGAGQADAWKTEPGDSKEK